MKELELAVGKIRFDYILAKTFSENNYLESLMDLKNLIKMLKAERQLILRVIENLSDEQFLKIPAGRNNNIIWNLGHIIVTQQVLHYTLSRLELKIPKEMASMFRTGTNPGLWKETPNITELKSHLIEIPDKFLEDYENGLFKEFRPYKTSTGVELNSFEDSVAFNFFHEGAHTGIILGLVKMF